MQETEALEVPTKKRGRQPNEKKEIEEPTIQSGELDEDFNFSSKQVIEKQKKPVQKFKVPDKVNRTFVLADGKKHGTYTIIAVEDVIDPKTNMPRRARLLRGANSIWMDEQQQFEKIKGYVEKNVLSLVFNKGRMDIPMGNSLKNQFTDVSNRNLDNPNRRQDVVMKEYFKEWDTVKISEKALIQEELELEAIGIASRADIDSLIPHAHYLGVDFIDPMSGSPLDEKGIRTAYMRKAKADPKKFMNSIHSPVVQISHKIRRAIDGGKIDLGKIANQAFWVDGGFICVLPQGRNAIEYLTEFSQLQSDASNQFVYQLDNVTS